MKVNSTSFKGFLVINGANSETKYGKYENVKMVKPANVIFKIKDDKKGKSTRIYSNTNETVYSVPYSVATPAEVFAAYSAAVQRKNIIVEI